MMTFKEFLEYDFNRKDGVPVVPKIQLQKPSTRNSTLKPYGPKDKPKK